MKKEENVGGERHPLASKGGFFDKSEVLMKANSMRQRRAYCFIANNKRDPSSHFKRPIREDNI